LKIEESRRIYSAKKAMQTREVGGNEHDVHICWCNRGKQKRYNQPKMKYKVGRRTYTRKIHFEDVDVNAKHQFNAWEENNSLNSDGDVANEHNEWRERRELEGTGRGQGSWS
jgi:hypothetical protein